MSRGASVRHALLLAALVGCGDAPAETPECTLGTLGCECAAGDVCAATPTGHALTCDRGLCRIDCALGETACECDAGSCFAASDECTADGYCRPADCVAGQESCTCLAGTCGAGLYCIRDRSELGTCVDDTGYPGGACPAEGLCQEQSRCDASTDRCVPCTLGSAGCIPDGTRCNEGLNLEAGRCVAPPPMPPTDPQCYTRCRNDLVSPDGTVRRCDSEGLMEGCVDDHVCMEGSCVPPDELPDGCVGDTDCPDFQHCIARRCYSDCERDSDCSTGRVCHHRVCRVPCDRTALERDECPERTYCDSESGVGGVCMPLVEDDGAEPHTEVDAGYTLSQDTVDVSGGPDTFVIRTDSLTREDFTVTPVSHRAYDRDGALVDEAGEGDSPLPWLEIVYEGTRATGSPLVITVEPGCTDAEECPPVTVRAVSPVPTSWTRWEGSLMVESATLGRRLVAVYHSQGLTGRWVGDMHYFANFGEEGLPEWRASADRTQAGYVKNGLIQQWAGFRGGILSGGFDEMRAVLTATHTGSWQWPSVRSACDEPGGACYLYDGATDGLRSYVGDLRSGPVPTGPTQMPIALNLRQDETDATRLQGRIDSAAALHYAGDPAIDLQFVADPTDPATCGADGVPSNCVAYLVSEPDTPAAVAVVGGRYPVPAGTTTMDCGDRFEAQDSPWLIPGFREDTAIDPTTGMAFRTHCRDTRVPLLDMAAGPLNASLAGANPIADGRVRRRRLHIVDGALVDSETLFILFEERFDSVLSATDTEGFSAYGYMILTRATSNLESADFVGSPAPDPLLANPDRRRGVSCDPDLLLAVYPDGSLTPATPAGTVWDVTRALVDGRLGTLNDIAPAERVHYYCEATGLIDGGPNQRGLSTDAPISCPAGSNVTFFAFTVAIPDQAEIAGLACQQGYDPVAGTRATCGTTVEAWRSREDVAFDVLFRCDGSTFCSQDRTDLRSGKIFSQRGAESLFLPLGPAIEQAFRYKIQFQTGDGRSAGFAPAVCAPSSDTVPYCYDPAAIEEIRARLDCLMDIYRRYPGIPGLSGVLSESLAYVQTSDGSLSTPLIEDGFERLYAELLIMLGDDSMTNALRSRFDTAATRGATFQGSLFEPGGIDLSGVAGFEMYSLYQAAQYYQTALDRFYDLAPVISDALARGDAGNPPSAITPGVVTWYIERLVRGSSQKSRAWAEIAKRYQQMNRPELARRVLERAFAASYLESIILSRLMLRISDRLTNSQRSEIERQIETAQQRYSVAMAEMREVYGEISDITTQFGFPLGYVPFPVRDDGDFRASNAFEDVLRTTREFVESARRHEDEAITSARSFDTDAVSFQSELVRIGRSYEERLGPICGYFEGDDGRVYPAIERYAERNERAAALGTPCGLMGNGAIHQQLGTLQRVGQQHELLQLRHEHLLAQMTGEAERASRQCGVILDLADFTYRRGVAERGLQRTIEAGNAVIRAIQAAREATRDISLITTNLNSYASNSGVIAVAVASFKTAIALEHIAMEGVRAGIVAAEDAIAFMRLGTAHYAAEAECQRVTIDSAATMANLGRQLEELNLEGGQLLLDYLLAEAELRRMLLEAERIEEQREEAEQLALNTEAVRNDPNMRLFRNDAILNADRSFQLAIKHVYRTTRVFEHYTSQSYAGLERLFLIRMVARGEDNLDRYLSDMHDRFLLWEEEYRAPARRVRRLSLRDDIFQIALQDDDGRELSQSERNRLMRERLTDPELLDRNGHLSIPFSTGAEELSPCTKNHKLDWIEVQMIGSDLGDDQAEVRLWQEGTGVVETLGEGTRYYRLPEALLVANPYFGRNQIFDPAVYRRYEFRERPYINTAWSLVFDQRDTLINQDVDLSHLTDMVLYLYYTDFTDADACRR